MLRDKKGQSTLEYAIIIAVVVAALLALNTYMKKAVQGKLKESSDEIGQQFEPGKFTSGWTTVSSGTTTTKESRDAASGDTVSTVEQAETITRAETEAWGGGTSK